MSRGGGGAVSQQIRLQQQEPLIFNRVFILGGKGLNEDQWRENFQEFGNIDKVAILTDKQTGDQKGVCYIHYDKTSEAAAAVEAMNGQVISGQNKPIKVLFAQGKKDSLEMDCEEDTMLRRLFIKTPKDKTHDDLKEYFSQFGPLEWVRILRDKGTQQSRGLAFVKFETMAASARALEDCETHYKPRWADVRRKEDDSNEDNRGGQGGRQGQMSNTGIGQMGGGNYGFSDSNMGGGGYGGGYGNFGMGGGMGGGGGGGMGGGRMGGAGAFGFGGQGGFGMDGMAMGQRRTDPMGIVESGCSADVGPDNLDALMPTSMTQEQVMRLFDIAPGLESCTYDVTSGIAKVQYTSPKCASYAKEKLDGLDYAGLKIAVRYGKVMGSGALKKTAEDLQRTLMMLQSQGGADQSQLTQIVSSIQRVTEAIQNQGVGDNYNEATGEEMVPWCSVPLPPRKPRASYHQPIEARLFIVAVPEAFGNELLENALCRFGDLINVKFQDGKRFGFAKFANKESADLAKITLHGAYINNNRLKLEYATDPSLKQDGDDGQANRKRRKEWND